MSSRRQSFSEGLFSGAKAFADQTNSEIGGATVHPVSKELPQIGDKGWMVGGHPDTSGQRIPETIARSPLSVSDAAAHMVKTAIKTGGAPDGYAGSWVRPTTGEVILDASTRIHGRKAARHVGNQRGEDAMFGFEHGTDVTLREGNRKAKRARKTAAGGTP